MVRGFGYHPREFMMDGLFPSESSKQANLSAELSSLPPLNLTLRKTPSFLNLLKTKLSKPDNSASNQAAEKLKASNFPASFLRIGSWQEVSRNEADLVAKCYYSKKKLVWEVLKDGLKSKIEIQWSEISAIRATLLEDHPGILEIELDQAPTFYRESDPQPRKHTIWHMTTDFTGGQASLHRRHYIKFPPGVLDRHYEKLLQNDQRLMELGHKPFPSHDSPYFDWAPYSYHLNYSFDPPGRDLKAQIDFGSFDPRDRHVPHGPAHQPMIQTQTHHQSMFGDPTFHFEDSTASPISGPSGFHDNNNNTVPEFSSPSEDQIPGFSFAHTGNPTWGHGMDDFSEDRTFYGTTTMTIETRTFDMGITMPSYSNIQQNLLIDNSDLQYSYGTELNLPARSFEDSSYVATGGQFSSVGGQTCPQFSDSYLPSRFNDGDYTPHQFGNVYVYPPFSHGF